MGLNPTPNKDLQELEAKFNDRKMLWTHIDKFFKLQDDWFNKDFKNTNAEDVEKEMKSFENGILQLKTRI
jgi:dynein heavy chain